MFNTDRRMRPIFTFTVSGLLSAVAEHFVTVEDCNVLLFCFSKLLTSQKSRALQSSTVFRRRVSYLFESNVNDTYVLKVIHIKVRRFFPTNNVVQIQAIMEYNRLTIMWEICFWNIIVSFYSARFLVGHNLLTIMWRLYETKSGKEWRWHVVVIATLFVFLQLKRFLRHTQLCKRHRSHTCTSPTKQRAPSKPTACNNVPDSRVRPLQ